MYKCNSCNRIFDRYDTVTEESGEKWYVCPYCSAADFNEIRARNDRFLTVKKAEVIEALVAALSAVNEEDIHGVKEILTEFICDLVGESPFLYREGLTTVTDADKDRLTDELCALTEVVHR